MNVFRTQANVERVLQLRAEGLTHSEIADRMGVSKTTIHKTIRDGVYDHSWLTRHNRDRYVDLTGRIGRDGEVTTNEWNRQRIIQAIQAWARKTGKPPTSTQWKKPNGIGPGHFVHGKRGARPTPSTVAKFFGTWSEAIRAAGYEPLQSGWNEATRVSTEKRSKKNRCKRGHPLSGTNLHIRPNGERTCRACHRLLAKRSRRRKDKTHAPHGTETAYSNWGCRCEVCKEAKAAKDSARYLARKAKESSP